MRFIKKLFGMTALALFGANAWAETVAKVVETSQEYATLAEAIAAAQTGQTVEIVTAGDISIPSTSKQITIRAAKVEGSYISVNVPLTAAYYTCVGTYVGVTFEGIVFSLNGDQGLCGFNFNSHGPVTFNACTFNNLFTTFGTQIYNGCTFNQDNTEYHFWTYGAYSDEDHIDYNNCTFNGKGKYFNCYTESGYLYTLNINNCVFNNDAAAKKAAVLVKEVADGKEDKRIRINFTGTNTLNGNYPIGCYEADVTAAGGDGLWAVEGKAIPDKKCTIFVGNDQIYPAVPDVARVVSADGATTNVCKTLQAAADAAVSGDTIELLADYAVGETETVAFKDGVTFTAGAFKLTGSRKVSASGTCRISAVGYSGDFVVGKTDVPTVLTTDGFVARGKDGILYVTDGSTVTFSGNGFNLDEDDETDNMMIENAAEEKNSWDEFGNLNHVGNTVNITDVSDTVNGFKAYALYTNANSTNNITDAAFVKTEFLNAYGGAFNVKNSNLNVDQTVNVTGKVNIEGGSATMSYVNVYAGYQAGYNGGKLTAKNTILDGTDWQMQIGNTRSGSKYYEKGDDAAAVLTLVNSTLKSSQLTNKGTIRMDAASKIVLLASGENDFAGDYQGNDGCVEVDMTDATADSYTLIDAATASTYGTEGVNCKFAAGKDNGYALSVIGNDLVAQKVVVKIGNKGYGSLDATFADAAAGATIVLVGDFTVADDATLADKDVTLDLAGNDMTVAAGKALTFGAGSVVMTDSVGGAVVRGVLSVVEGGSFAIAAGTFDHDPTAYVAVGKGVRDNGNGTWTVVVPDIHVDTKTEPETREVEVESAEPLTEEQQAKAASEVETIKTNLVVALIDPVVASADTGIKGTVTEESKQEIVNALLEDADDQNLTEAAKEQIYKNIDDFLDPESESNSSSNFLNIAVQAVDTKIVASDTTVASVAAKATAVVYEVKPIIETTVSNTVGGVTEVKVVKAVIPNETVKELAEQGRPMTFNLPISDPKATCATVKHVSAEPDKYPTETFTCSVWEKDGKRYITISVSHFSTFEVMPSGAVLVDSDETIGITKLDRMTAGFVSFGVPYTQSGVNTETNATLGQLLVTGVQSGEFGRSWVPGKDDFNTYESVKLDDEVTPGQPFWYERKADSLVPLTLAGYVVTNELTTAGAASTTDRPGLSHFANPKKEAFDALEVLTSTPQNGDEIVLVGDTTRYFYEGGWKKKVPGAVLKEAGGVTVRGVPTDEDVTSIPVAKGRTFWYITKTTAATVKW